MKRFITALCTAFLLATALFAQESDEDDRYDITYNLNQRGDQFINIGLMVTMPMNFGGDFPLYRDGNLNMGGMGMLGYHRFLTGWFALGADVCFGYNPTIGKNIFTYVPFMLNMTVQPWFRHFEVPLTLGVGAAMESYLDNTYFPGLVLKATGGVFYRVTPSWSFGISYDFMYMPQWYKGDDAKHNDYGLFSSFQLGARYHF